ncbi:MAG: hypothetical protein JKY54_19390, partial [Flavobacteriales bacterium]|nr:hypothetical protein [Flavobacteriales bacterium]
MLVILLKACVVSAETVDVSATQNINSLITSKFVYFEDVTGLIKPQDIISKADDYPWTKIDRSSISFGFTRST